jgi:hypothetical protein
MKTKSIAESLALAGLAPMLLILVSCGGKADDDADPEFKEITAYARKLANSGENCLKVFGKPNAAASVLGSLIIGRCVVALEEEKALAEAIVYTEYEGIQNGLTPDQAANACLRFVAAEPTRSTKGRAGPIERAEYYPNSFSRSSRHLQRSRRSLRQTKADQPWNRCLGRTLNECKQYYSAVRGNVLDKDGPLGKDDLGLDCYEFYAQGYSISVSFDVTGKAASVIYAGRGTFEDGGIEKILANNAPKAKWYGPSTYNLNDP